MVTGDADVVQTLELTDDERIYGPILLGYPKDDASAFVARGLASLAPAMIKWI